MQAQHKDWHEAAHLLIKCKNKGEKDQWIDEVEQIKWFECF